MNAALRRAYHALPPPLRTVAASLAGYYLRAWRYGPETEELVAAALERDRWSEARWRAWREERLAAVLHRAATRVPYYRDRWARRRRAGDGASWERLESWPLLDKEEVRRAPRAFVADDVDPRRMFREHTSGTTGTPLELHWSRATVRAWYALFEARARRWYGVSRRDPWAILGGQLVVPASQRRPPFWVWNAGLRQLYLSSIHISPDNASAYARALDDHGVLHLYGYTSALHALANEVRRPTRVVVTNAEPVLPHQREAIEAAFGPVRETYGMAELAAAAGECEAGRLHLWPEAGHVELQDDEIVATGLLNADMPLVRYRTGDRGRLAPPGAACACGRTLPLLEAIEGRADDELLTPDGRRVGRMDPVFKARLPIREAQIVQEALDRLRVRVVPAPGYDRATADQIARSVRERMGEVQVVVEEVARLPRTAAGKLRAVVREIGAAR